MTKYSRDTAPKGHRPDVAHIIIQNVPRGLFFEVYLAKFAVSERKVIAFTISLTKIVSYLEIISS